MNSFVALTLLAIVAVASSTNVNSKSVMTDILETIIENNRGKAANINIPNINLGDSGTLTNVNVQNVETFVVERLDGAGLLSLDIKNLTVTLEVATFSAGLENANIQVSDLGLAVVGNGDATGSASRLRITVALDLSLKGLTPVLEDFSGLDISVGGVSIDLQGVDNAADASNIVNTKLAAYLTANLVTIAGENKEKIIAAINVVLAGLVKDNQ